MKINEVTQKNELRLGMTRNVYAVNERGEYTKVPEGWESEIIMSPSLEEIFHQKAQAARQHALSGDTSPLAYYMFLRLMDVKDLARAMGIAAWRVKRHMKPSVFNRLDERMIQAYATLLKVSKEELKCIREDS